MAHIRSKTDLPLMIDEGLKGSREMRQIIKVDAADKVNIKLMKCGGIYPAVKLAHQAEMAGIECQVGCMVRIIRCLFRGIPCRFSKKLLRALNLQVH